MLSGSELLNISKITITKVHNTAGTLRTRVWGDLACITGDLFDWKTQIAIFQQYLVATRDVAPDEHVEFDRIEEASPLPRRKSWTNLTLVMSTPQSGAAVHTHLAYTLPTMLANDSPRTM